VAIEVLPILCKPSAAGTTNPVAHGVADTSSVSPTAIRSTTSIWRDLAPTKYSSTCSATTRATSRCIPNSRPIFASISHRLWLWGKNDPFFLPAGAEAFKRDIPNADVRFFDTGHFALETHAEEIAAAIRDFLAR
jgi:pimeloyl-ACP methyl ester carboxylesterase